MPTAAELSVKLGCTLPPGLGVEPQGGPTGTIQYECTGANPISGAPYSRLEIFASPGDETVFIDQNKRYESANEPIMQVKGTGWSVWGTDSNVIAAAVNAGGHEV